MKTYIQINPQDNVCVALAPISAGTQINAGTTVTTLEDIPQGQRNYYFELTAKLRSRATVRPWTRATTSVSE